MAAVSIAVRWFAFAVVWLITANYNKSRAPAQRGPWIVPFRSR